MTAPNTVLTWQVEETGGYETAWVELAAGRLRAHGRAVGLKPEPYWLSYELDTDAGYVTRRLHVTSHTVDGTYDLELRRDERSRWTANGQVVLALDGALDCDLGMSPLTNTMPVLRHQLHRNEGHQDFLMAFVPVPTLAVRPSIQGYTHLTPLMSGARLGYASGTYRSEIDVDADGLVVHYEGLATRLNRAAPKL
ncbi:MULTISPECIES: putative glycolipid-binding domain-containing protein [unclassified Streptomyces]|uniref:putative glycolipid-binding domain-containing protein n=1 Tax=unclassified Streptomyces TaxID=2593676 RepID=UPI0036E5EC9A